MTSPYTLLSRAVYWAVRLPLALLDIAWEPKGDWAQMKRKPDQ